MASHGSKITKAEQISYFTSNFRNVVQSQTVWYEGSGNPGTGFYDVYGTGVVKNTPDPGGPSTGNLSSEIVDSSILRDLFHLHARNYTSHRRHNFIRTGNTPGATNQTQIQAFELTYDQDAFFGTINATGGNYSITHGSAITASNFNGFVNNLRSQWDSYKLNTLTTNVNYCHSSCHSSCHSAGRGRR